MAMVFGSNQGNFNGATPVTLVAAPAASTTRIIRGIRVWNADTAAVAITVSKAVSGTPYGFAAVAALASLASWDPLASGTGVLFLTATTQSLVAVMGGAPATNQPQFEVSYVDWS